MTRCMQQRAVYQSVGPGSWPGYLIAMARHQSMHVAEAQLTAVNHACCEVNNSVQLCK